MVCRTSSISPVSMPSMDKWANSAHRGSTSFNTVATCISHSSTLMLLTRLPMSLSMRESDVVGNSHRTKSTQSSQFIGTLICSIHSYLALQCIDSFRLQAIATLFSFWSDLRLSLQCVERGVPWRTRDIS